MADRRFKPATDPVGNAFRFLLVRISGQPARDTNGRESFREDIQSSMALDVPQNVNHLCYSEPP
ncbi:MAG: hypothetical protein U0941_17205 [Planctomycetaceae bacterium]